MGCFLRICTVFDPFFSSWCEVTDKSSVPGCRFCLLYFSGALRKNILSEKCFLPSRYGAPHSTFLEKKWFVRFSGVDTIMALATLFIICLRRNRRFILLLLERLPVLLLVARRYLCALASYTFPPRTSEYGFYLNLISCYI